MKSIPEIITDDFILEFFIQKNGQINRNYSAQKWLANHTSIKTYLENRFPDSSSIQETIYRIQNHIEIRPTCQYCGNSTKFLGRTIGFQSYCSMSCLNKSEEHINKVKQTCIEHFGGTGAMSSLENRKKAEQTCFDHYEVLHPMQSEEIKYKTQLHDLEFYGVPYHIASEEIIEKANKTREQRYGDPYFINREKIKQVLLEQTGYDSPFKNPKIQERIKIKTQSRTSEDQNIINKKAKQTKFNKYGNENFNNREKANATIFERYHVKNIFQDEIIYQRFINGMKETDSIYKAFETKKKNGTLNSSKIEQLFKNYLETHFPNDFIYQYKSELYPFHCDFYIQSLDLYIEIQGSWTHGAHPFDETNDEDIAKLNLWKSKQTKFYENAIKTWTIRDVHKRTIAQQNNLNYLEIFSNNLEECITIFKDKIR